MISGTLNRLPKRKRKLKINGKNGIYAQVIRHSVSQTGDEIITFELCYPRIIHSEFLTHRMFSRNSASSRAIPFEKMKEQLSGMPVRFGAANKGMQDKGEHSQKIRCGVIGNMNEYSPDEWWYEAKISAISYAQKFYEAGYAKQVFNRITEPFQMMKTVMTSTEFSNFFWLRLDEEAVDPTIFQLASCIHKCYQLSVPRLLMKDEWHLPYINSARLSSGELVYFDSDDASLDSYREYSLEEAKIISAARCAAVSFRNTDYPLDKCKEVFEKLSGERIHGSAMEHQATPICVPLHMKLNSAYWPEGVSHIDRNENLWSGNFKGWIQHRKLIKGENHES